MSRYEIEDDGMLKPFPAIVSEARGNTNAFKAHLHSWTSRNGRVGHQTPSAEKWILRNSDSDANSRRA